MKERNTGLDALRLVCMALVVLYHMLTHGGLGAAAIGKEAHFTVCLLQALSACAVDCFALLSGFAASGTSKRPLSRGALLWLSAAFWSVLLTAVFKTDGIRLVPALKRAATPVISQQYWYFTAFFPMLFFAPLAERAMESCSGQSLWAAAIAGFFLFCMLPAYAETDLFGTGNGYYTLWLLALYLAGGALRRWEAPSRLPAPLWILPAAVCCLLTASVKFRGDAPGTEFTAPLRYTAPLTVLCAAALLLFFGNLRIPEGARKAISGLSRAAFGVYLIHDHPAVRARFFEGRYAGLAEMPSWLLILRAAGHVFVVFLICLALEGLRLLLFRVLCIPELLRKGEDRLREKLYPTDK